MGHGIEPPIHARKVASKGETLWLGVAGEMSNWAG